MEAPANLNQNGSSRLEILTHNITGADRFLECRRKSPAADPADLLVISIINLEMLTRKNTAVKTEAGNSPLQIKLNLLARLFADKMAFASFSPPISASPQADWYPDQSHGRKVSIPSQDGACRARQVR